MQNTHDRPGFRPQKCAARRRRNPQTRRSETKIAPPRGQNRGAGLERRGAKRPPDRAAGASPPTLAARSKTGELLTLKSGAFLIAGNADADMVPCRIIYDTPDKRMHMFCRIRICFGTLIPAEEMKVEDPRRSVPKLRALRTRLKTELERLYEENHF